MLPEPEVRCRGSVVFADEDEVSALINYTYISSAGVMFHHGSTQTPKLEQKEHKTKFHRDTQTVDQRTRSVQSTRETGTQMPKKGTLCFAFYLACYFIVIR